MPCYRRSCSSPLGRCYPRPCRDSSEACSEALHTAQEMAKRIADEKEALQAALEEQERTHACQIRNYQLEMKSLQTRMEHVTSELLGTQEELCRLRSINAELESNVANAVKQARAYKADKSELKCKLQRLSQEERLRAEEAQRTCDALSTEVRHARGSAEKLAAALKDCLLEKRSILSFLTEVFSTPPDTSTLIKPSVVQNAKLGGRELLGLMGNLEIEIHDAAMHLHHMLQRIREESKYTDTVFDSNLQSFTVEELIHRLLQERQDSGGSCVLEDACHCPTLPVTCRIDWRLEKDRYLRLKHVINRKVAQLLKVQKLAKSGATAAANRCPLY